MSEEIEVGGVSVRIRAIALGFDEVMTKMQTAFNKIGTVGQQVLQSTDAAAVKVRETASAAQNTAEVAASIGKDTSGIDKYSIKLDSLNSKYDAQSIKVQKLSMELDDMARQYAELMQATGGNTDFDLAAIAPDLTSKYDQELAKLDELRNSIRLTEQERTNATQKTAAAQDTAIIKQEQLNQKMADKTSKTNTKMGMDKA